MRAYRFGSLPCSIRRYSDADGELNTAMNQNVLFKKKEWQQLLSNFKDLCKTRKKYDETTFSFKVDSIGKQIGEIDDEFIASCPEYGWAIKNETASDLYGMLCIAHRSDRMADHFMKPISSHKPFFTSNKGALIEAALSFLTMQVILQYILLLRS